MVAEHVTGRSLNCPFQPRSSPPRPLLIPPSYHLRVTTTAPFRIPLYYRHKWGSLYPKRTTTFDLACFKPQVPEHIQEEFLSCPIATGKTLLLLKPHGRFLRGRGFRPLTSDRPQSPLEAFARPFYVRKEMSTTALWWNELRCKGANPFVDSRRRSPYGRAHHLTAPTAFPPRSVPTA